MSGTDIATPPAMRSADAELQARSIGRAELPANVVKSAGRTIQILEYFDDVQSPRNVIEIARALGLPQSSASVLLRSLETLGYLYYDPLERTYQPTTRVGLLGSWVEPQLLRGGALVDLMRSLNRATRRSVVLAARNGLDSQFLHVEQDAETPSGFNVPVGSKLPLSRSVVFPIFLADAAEGEVSKLVRRINAYAGPGSPLVRADEILERIRRFRRERFVFDRSETDPEVSVLALAVRSEAGSAPLAISLVGPHAPMERDLAALVEEMHRQIDSYFLPKGEWRPARGSRFA